MSANPIQKALEAAHACRLGMEGQASSALTACIDALLPILQSGQLDVPPADFMQLLEQIISAQQRNDPIRLADLLEFVLVPVIAGDGETAA